MTQATIEAAAFILRRLFDRATDPTLTYDDIEATVDNIARRFDTAGLKAVARACGCTYGLRPARPRPGNASSTALPSERAGTSAAR